MISIFKRKHGDNAVHDDDDDGGGRDHGGNEDIIFFYGTTNKADGYTDERGP